MYKLAACSIRLQGRKLSFLICFQGVMLSFSHWVISDSLWPHELQDARFLFPSLSPWACSNSCPLKSVMPSNYLILCRPLLLLPSIFPSIWVFSSESALRIRWPKYWSFSFSISPSNEYSGLISFRIDCPLLSKGLSRVFFSAIFWKHRFFGAQLSLRPALTPTHDYWKTIALTGWTFITTWQSRFSAF